MYKGMIQHLNKDTVIAVCDFLAQFTMKDENGNRFQSATHDEIVRQVEKMSMTDWAILSNLIYQIRHDGQE